MEDTFLLEMTKEMSEWMQSQIERHGIIKQHIFSSIFLKGTGVERSKGSYMKHLRM